MKRLVISVICHKYDSMLYLLPEGTIHLNSFFFSNLSDALKLRGKWYMNCTLSKVMVALFLTIMKFRLHTKIATNKIRTF